MLAPFVLRRLKRDVLDQLSDKISVVERLQMTDFQRQVYDSILSGHAQRKEDNKAKLKAQIEKEELLDGKPKKNNQKNNNGNDSKSNKTLSFFSKSVQKDEPIDLTETPDSNSEVTAIAIRANHNSKRSQSGGQISNGGDEEDPAVIAKMLKKMSNAEINNLFTALRKAANHPLLLRIRYNDEAVLNKIAMVLRNIHFLLYLF